MTNPMDKPSLKALREKYEESLQSPPLGDYNALLGALPALLAIAEAAIADRKAQEAVSRACLDDMDSEEAQAAFQQGHDADKALAAALALVEE